MLWWVAYAGLAVFLVIAPVSAHHVPAAKFDAAKPLITVQGIAARDGSTTAWGDSVVVTATGRQVFTVTPAQPPAVQPGQPTPRWPDRQPRLGPPAGQIMGYWAFPSATILVEQGVNVQADAHGTSCCEVISDPERRFSKR